MCNICSLLLPLVCLPFIRPSIISSSKLSYLKICPIQWCCLCCVIFIICLSSLYTQLILSILRHIHISKASYHRTSIFVSVHVSAAYSATFEIRHLIILFFNSKLIWLFTDIRDTATRSRIVLWSLSWVEMLRVLDLSIRVLSQVPK